MAELLTSAQMRAIEAAAIESGAVTGLELMERAGRGVVEAILAEWPELVAGSFRAVVLCGPGNNGGDGFVVARLLRERGWEVTCYAWDDLARQGPDARAMRARWEAAGGETVPFREFHVARDWFDVAVDALYGIGMRDGHGVDASLEEFLSCTERMVAVDVPSGLIADDGRSVEPKLVAALTVTFHAPKLGHFLGVGPGCCGKLVVKEIGLSGGGGVPLVDPPSTDRLKRTFWTNKYSNGAVLVLGGPAGRGGAARLAARGALRIGAGVVTVGCPSAALVENAARLDAVMLRVVEDGGALEAVLEDGRIGVVCLGPGLGTGAREVGLVAAALGGRGEPLQRRGEPRPTGVVLDADALTILSREAGLFGALHGACVLTPHGGEFARLFPDIAERLLAPAVTGPAYSKVDATREAAVRAGCVVLFKGADTVIAAPDGRCAVNSAQYERAAPWLATAGSGDVLAGFIAGLMARGFSPFDAACTGAWLHVDCAREFGPGLIAEDLPEMLPAVFRRLGV
ncbi:NAD(P)H-hydrate dehydratase [Rhodobacter sp. HX-7-19]|uniref:Bifunctional NAD(P)H-hydrate repair enzyme n=1 Tax=Paragemmobacter kunshanensis TaxID=2583234 RepID=A0A6M1TXM7_9RHOB|nr:NAD(P)H-hydrate dehydratase [Rhodobacter kunshanensis]NGQ90902.1 NAD(P)H-hydrate dehydratase [Rhodobacter kunshanensis]